MMKKLLAVSLVCVALTGCSAIGDWFEEDEKPPLPGERISVLELQKALEPEDPVLATQGLIAPDPWRNEFWPQVGGYPNHSMQHLQLSESPLQLAWTADIGEGTNSSFPLIAQPVIVEKTIFTLDSESHLSAFDIETGKQLWRFDVTSPKEEDPVIGGGIAFSGGVLYVTNGYNEILAMNPENGKIFWRKPIPSPARAAPTVMEDRIFLTTLDDRLIALSTADGSQIWEYKGLNEIAGLVGAASAAANRDIVVPVFTSGEITALRIENGSVAWTDNLANLKSVGGLAGLADIRGLPVIDKGLVFAVSYSGKMVAIDERSGTRVWQREIGGAQTPWLAGNYIFVLSASNQLVAMGRDNGVIRWVTDLARWGDEKKRKDPVTWVGPVLAGNRLILAGTGGRVVEISPENGKMLTQWSVGKTISIPPVIAGGTLYLLADDGTLMAYK